MRTRSKLLLVLLATFVCAQAVFPCSAVAASQKKTKKEKAQLPPPLPSGPRGPVPQVPLDSIPPVAPQVSYDHGQLTILAPNSTLGDILRLVRKQTGADIDIPPGATERVVTQLGPAPAASVVSELLNGSHFNYVLLGSPSNSEQLTRVVLVPKTGPDNVGTVASSQPGQPGQRPAHAAPVPGANPDSQGDETSDAMDAETPAEDNSAAAEEAPDQNAAENDQAAPQPADQQQGVKTPQQMLQEMQQRQLQLQQQGNPGQPGAPAAPPPQSPPEPEQQQ